MEKNSNVDPGYLTITQATLLTLKVMRQEVTKESITYWQDKIRNKAKEGKLGGKPYKKECGKFQKQKLLISQIKEKKSRMLL